MIRILENENWRVLLDEENRTLLIDHFEEKRAIGNVEMPLSSIQSFIPLTNDSRLTEGASLEDWISKVKTLQEDYLELERDFKALIRKDDTFKAHEVLGDMNKVKKEMQQLKALKLFGMVPDLWE